MKSTQVFASRVFFWSAVYGIAVLLPLYFMEDRLGQQFPPAFNRPEQFYGFLGVALAWQLAFILIARDVQRYRLFMLPAIAEKFLSSIAVLVLHAQGRVSLPTAIPSVIDLLIGCLFVVAFVACAPKAPGTTRAGDHAS